MYTCNSSDCNETAAFYRLVNSMKKAKEKGRGFTAIIGAGCSLTSSSSDISTTQIIESSIRNIIPDYKKPNSWMQLYSDFVNNIWEPYGERERREILASHFLDLTPAIGYEYLRILVENGYITNIITTNFDMLINTALKNLSYQLYVGEQRVRDINGGGNIKVFKIHGDIESGELRFSPSDLKDLPRSISELVHDATKNSFFFCGYSGQDEGLMKCINKNGEYSIYWVSPNKPVRDNVYDTRLIYDLMCTRKQENSFICGEQLGKFDTFMKQLHTVLIEKNMLLSSEPLWEKSTIGDAIKINPRVFSIFAHLLQCSNLLRTKHEWEKRFPFFSKDYETTLDAYLFYYRDSAHLPANFLQTPVNEIEALIMGLAIEIVASTSGIKITPTDYAEQLKEEFESANPQYRPDDSFWRAIIAVLSSIETNTPLIENKDLLDIKLNMNNNGRMTLSVKNPQLSYLVDTISLLSVSGLFIPTCEDDGNIDLIGKSKLLLQTRGKSIETLGEKLCFKLEGISKRELRTIFEAFFENLNGYYIDENNTIVGPKVTITSSISEKEAKRKAESLSDFLYKLANDTTSKFKRLRSAFEIDSNQYIKAELDDELKNFLQSDKIGMFAIGSSGAGKTKAVQNFINNNFDYNKSGYLIAVSSPKISSFESALGISVFWKEWLPHSSEKTLLNEINSILSERKKNLLLIIDGLNEIDGGASVCSQHYSAIIQTINELNELGIKTIKILVTCRDHAFLDYCEQTSLNPAEEICYCSISTQITPYFHIKPLSLEQQLQFADLYFEDKNQRDLFEIDIKNNPYIQQIFNLPYMIAIAGKNYFSSQTGVSIYILQDIFKLFTEQMLKRLGSHSVESTARTIVNAYFELIIRSTNFGRRVTVFTLLNQLPSNIDKEEAVVVLGQLCDINLFTNIHADDYIRFTHDRIEEYFLCEYLFSKGNNLQALYSVSKIAKGDLIFYSAIVNYFRKLAKQSAFAQLVESCYVLYNDNVEQMPILLVSCLELFDENKYHQLFVEVNRSEFEFDTFTMLLLSGLKHAITRDDICYPESLIGYYESLSTSFPTLDYYRKYFYYITSKFFLMRKGERDEAEHFCDLALQQKSEDEHLSQLVKFQKAVILRNEGHFDEAIEKFASVFAYFSSKEYWDSAAECVVEWGGALRQKTHFDAVLEVYQKIDMECLENFPVLKIKLHRQKGNLYKNIMSVQLQKYHNDNHNVRLKDEITLNYKHALSEFESAVRMSVNVVNMIEKIAILEEQAVTATKYSAIDPKQITRAKFWLDEAEKLLALFPVPDIRIIHMRHVARYKSCIGEIKEAITILEQARVYSENHANTFRLFEIDYQMGHLVEAHKEKLSAGELKKGIDAYKNAINSEPDRQSQYIINCIESLKRLEAFIDSAGIEIPCGNNSLQSVKLS